MSTKIKLLALANGDEYTNIEFAGDQKSFFRRLESESFIRLTWNGKEILINPEFVISLELG